ncbi:hypothetical protein CJU89_6283 [Yarrowia sp. B02]|nr:hypothetical protein CJU89_6283 [Yarrowia sp. B02]
MCGPSRASAGNVVCQIHSLPDNHARLPNMAIHMNKETLSYNVEPSLFSKPLCFEIMTSGDLSLDHSKHSTLHTFHIPASHSGQGVLESSIDPTTVVGRGGRLRWGDEVLGDGVIGWN